MEELKKWQAKENDTPKDLPRMTEKENQHNDAALALCQAASTTLEKDIIVLVNNCKYLYLSWRRGCTKTHNRYLKHVGEKH
jgi:hypothetical protein